MALIFIVVALFLCFIHIGVNYNRKARLIRKIPGPKIIFLIGNALDVAVSPDVNNRPRINFVFLAELFNLMRTYHNKWRSINRFWSFGLASVNVYTPEDIEVVISNTKHNEKSQLYSFLKSWLRDGLLLSSGTKWQTRRKILTPTFHFKILRQFYTTLEDNSQRLIETLLKSSGESLDVIPIISEFTLHSICETAMGTQLSNKTTEVARSYKESIYALGRQFVHRISRLYLYTDFMYNLMTFGKLKRHLDVVHKFTQNIISNRRQYFNSFVHDFDEHGANIYDDSNVITDDASNYYKKKIAMLDLLLNFEKNGMINSNGIQEEVDTFMFEGHDTTAMGLTYCLMSIANNKNVQDNIVAELDDIFNESTRPTEIGDLSKMRYLECCIKESMRLYPPVPAISRVLSEDIMLSGYLVPAGTFCHIQIFDVHRSEHLYKDPLVFNPDRFLAENCMSRHPYAYIPFSAGPRNCIGQKFAMMEMKSALSAVLRQFELLPVTKPSDLQFIVDLVLRPTIPIYVKFVKRNKN